MENDANSVMERKQKRRKRRTWHGCLCVSRAGTLYPSSRPESYFARPFPLPSTPPPADSLWSSFYVLLVYSTLYFPLNYPEVCADWQGCTMPRTLLLYLSTLNTVYVCSVFHPRACRKARLCVLCEALANLSLLPSLCF